MKKLIIIACILLNALCSIAQKSQEIDWHVPVVGGENGYFTKHYFLSSKLNAMLESSLGRGDGFDGQTMQIDVAETIFTDSEERYITKYSDQFAVLIFRNITADKADVFYYSKTYDDIEEAKKYQPTADEFQTWYTEAGYAKEMESPGMTTFTRNDALEFANYFAKKVNALKEIAKQDAANTSDEKMKKMASMMLLASLPAEWAKSKGYNSFKSMKAIEDGMKRFKDDKEILSIIKSVQ
jgi:hypothetical protein